MMYRRIGQRQRRYGYQTPTAYQSVNSNTGAAEAIRKIEDIPLPNEIETPPEFSSYAGSMRNSSIINFFKTRIHFEEIILIGLIIILLDEGITGIEDEFLLIILVYLLLA
ncbi:MAG: hypothetical protein N3I35_02965 [Clostridia bacterium]|nr:hypothetical protein [Clostridia bacterium]